MTNQPFIPALNLEGTAANGDRGLRPLLIAAWKMEKDTDGFALFMDIHRRSGLNLNDVLAVVKGIWQEDNEAVSFLKEKGRIIKFKLNPKKKEEEEMAKKKVNVKKQELKIIKQGKQVKNQEKQLKKGAGKKPVGKKVKVAASKNGINPFQAGSGIYIAFSQCEIPGTFEQIVKRTAVEFKKGKPISGDPQGRVKRILDGVKGGWHEKLAGLKIKKMKGDVIQVVKK